MPEVTHRCIGMVSDITLPFGDDQVPCEGVRLEDGTFQNTCGEPCRWCMMKQGEGEPPWEAGDVAWIEPLRHADLTKKPFKGIISNWSLKDQIIVGRCICHEDARDEISPPVLLYDKIIRGYSMRTSEVQRIMKVTSFLSIAETLNSFYILIKPRELENAGNN